MNKINLSTATKNLKKNLPLLVSIVAVLCLFLSPTIESLLIISAIFLSVTVIALLDQARSSVVLSIFFRLVSVLIASFILFIGYDTFKTTWMPSSQVAALANKLHLTTPILLLILGTVGCVVGFYSVYVLSCRGISLGTQMLKKKLLVQKKAEIVSNLKRNWFFPISAMAFFFLNASLTLGYFIGLLIVFVVSLVVASQIPSLFDFVKPNNKWVRIVSFMTTLGICWGGQSSFYTGWRVSPKAQALQAMLPIPIDVPGVVSVFGAIVAVFFVYICVQIFWKELVKIISNNGMFDDINVTEQIVYSIMIVSFAVFVVFSFAKTEAFYGTELSYDIIYTSDSPSLVKGNVYLSLTHPENDIRQPLFAVFAAPFLGIPYLFGKLIGGSLSVQAMLVNIVQVIMLFVANFMLAKTMRLNPIRRTCFMVLTSCTYTHLLFTLMMEQYIVAYFWLTFCIYLISENQRPNRFALWGASGTLLTSMILLPFMSEKNPFGNFKTWFADMVKLGFGFLVVILMFCRFDVIFDLMSNLSLLSSFTGKELTLVDKFYQYVSFVASCFIAPDAGVNSTAVDHISWQLNPVTDINFIGVAILLFVIISVILNRNKKSSLLSAGWIVFSVVMLLGLGWGTKENGLILYALYFGWAFMVLLFQLIEKIEDKLNMKFLIPVFSIAAVIALNAVNIPKIVEMVNFAITYYPA